MRYELDDEQGYEAAKDLLIRRCMVWADLHGLKADPFLLTVAFDSRHESADGRLNWWTPEQVRRFLLDWLPRKTAAEPGELEHAPQTLGVLIGYLDATGLLDPRGGSAAENAAAIEAAARDLPEALNDPERQGLGTFWVRTAQSAGVDITDAAAMNGFAQAVREGAIDYDRELLDRILSGGIGAGPDDARAFAQPPVLLPTDEELAEAAGRSRVVRQLRLLSEWAGRDGRPLTAGGYLRMPDARELVELLGTGDDLTGVRSSGKLPELNLLLEWAKRARVVRVAKGRLHAVAKAAPLLADPPALWRRAFETFGELRDVVCPPRWAGGGGESLLYEVFSEVIDDVLNTVYGMEHPVPVRRMEESVWQACGQVFPMGFDLDPKVQETWQRREREEIGRDLAGALKVLERLGAVELTEGLADPLYSTDLLDDLYDASSPSPESGDDLDREHGEPGAHGEPGEPGEPGARRSAFSPEVARRLREDLRRPGLLVRLTGLGLAAVRDRLLAEGREAGLVGELVDAPPAGLLGVIADHYTDETARTELSGWLAAHGDDIEPLIDAVRNCPFRARAARLLDALVRSLPEVEARLPGLRHDPVLGPIVIADLITEGSLRREDLDDRENLLAMTETILSLMETSSAESFREQFVRSMPRRQLKDLVADMLGSGHPATDALEELRELTADPVVLLGGGGRRGPAAPGARGRPTGKGKKGRKGGKRRH